jgi:hypothetical protein
MEVEQESDMFEHYSPRPWHLLFSVALLAIASLMLPIENWFWFGLCTILLGFGSGVWIILAGYFETYGQQWDRWSHFAEIMAKNRNPQVWAALGFVPPEEAFKIEIDTRSEPSSVFKTTEIYDMPCSSNAFTVLCDGVLMGQPLSETFWVSNKTFSSPTFRNVKKKLEEKQAIKLKIAGKPTQGFVLTRKGRELFLKHCSAGVRQMAEDPKFLLDTQPKKELST